MQLLNQNSLYECVRLGECTQPNFTNSALYRSGRYLVDSDVEIEDCAEHHVHSGENLPQFLICRSHSLENEISSRLGWRIESPIHSSRRIDSSGLEGRNTIGNGLNVHHLPSIPVISKEVVHMNLTSPIVVLRSSSYYQHPCVSQRSRLRSKSRRNESTIDLFRYPASPQTRNAFRARLKTLVRFYFRDVHLSWTKDCDSFQFLINAMLEQFPKASWKDGLVSKSVSNILRKKRHKYRKVAARGGIEPYS